MHIKNTGSVIFCTVGGLGSACAHKRTHTHTVLLLCRKCTTFTFRLKLNCDKLTVVSIGLSDLLPASVYVCKGVRKTEKIRTEKEEDGKGQEGNRMKVRVEEERETGVAMMREKGGECERTEERVERERGKDSGGVKKTFSHSTNELR